MGKKIQPIITKVGFSIELSNEEWLKVKPHIKEECVSNIKELLMVLCMRNEK